MFADPQSLTINTVAQSLPAVSRGENASIYRKADGLVSLRLSKQIGKRQRYLVEAIQTKESTTPFSSISITQSVKVQLIIDIPSVGTAFSDTEVKYVVNALTDWLSASSFSNTLKVLGQET